MTKQDDKPKEIVGMLVDIEFCDKHGFHVADVQPIEAEVLYSASAFKDQASESRKGIRWSRTYVDNWARTFRGENAEADGQDNESLN